MGPLLRVSVRWTSLAFPVSGPLPANQIRGCQRRGCRKAWGRGEGKLGPSANTWGARLPCSIGLCGCFLKLESTWDNPGLGEGLMGLQEPMEWGEPQGVSGWRLLCDFVDITLWHLSLAWVGISGQWCTALRVCLCVFNQEANAGLPPGFPAGTELTMARGLKGTMAVMWGRKAREGKIRPRMGR